MFESEESIRLGQQAVREVERMLFTEPFKEPTAVDPSHKVFYSQFLRYHFHNYEESSYESAIVALYHGFGQWRKSAISSVHPDSALSPGYQTLQGIYEGMSLGGLARHLEEEVEFASHGNGIIIEIDFDIEALRVIRGLATDSALLEEVINEASQLNNAA